MGCSLFSNYHFQMEITVMGFAKHFGHSLLKNSDSNRLHRTCRPYSNEAPGKFYLNGQSLGKDNVTEKENLLGGNFSRLETQQKLLISFGDKNVTIGC